MRRPRFLFIVLFLALTACAGTFKVVQLPIREADLYPLSQTVGGISVAVDEISNPDRAWRYFGADLIGYGVLPINITVSNHSGHRCSIKPSDVLLRSGKEVIDPLPIHVVTRLAKRASRARAETQEQIDDFFSRLSFTDTVLVPHDSYQGVLFFPVEDRHKRDPFFSVVTLFLEGRLKMEVVVTDIETHQRTHFGPFSVSI